MSDVTEMNIIPVRPLDEEAALEWLRALPGGSTTLPAAALARRWGWPEHRARRRLNAWQRAGLVRRRGRVVMAVGDTDIQNPKAVRQQSYCVYVIKSEPGPVKIGKAKNPRQRLKELQTTSPFPLSLEYIGECNTESAGSRIERQAQKNLWKKRTNGEWFDATAGQAMIAIEMAAAELGLELRRWGPRFTVSVKIDPELQCDLIAAGFLQPSDKTERGIVDAIKKAAQGYKL